MSHATQDKHINAHCESNGCRSHQKWRSLHVNNRRRKKLFSTLVLLYAVISVSFHRLYCTLYQSEPHCLCWNHITPKDRINIVSYMLNRFITITANSSTYFISVIWGGKQELYEVHEHSLSIVLCNKSVVKLPQKYEMLYFLKVYKLSTRCCVNENVWCILIVCILSQKTHIIIWCLLSTFLLFQNTIFWQSHLPIV